MSNSEFWAIYIYFIILLVPALFALSLLFGCVIVFPLAFITSINNKVDSFYKIKLSNYQKWFLFMHPIVATLNLIIYFTIGSLVEHQSPIKAKSSQSIFPVFVNNILNDDYLWPLAFYACVTPVAALFALFAYNYKKKLIITNSQLASRITVIILILPLIIYAFSALVGGIA